MTSVDKRTWVGLFLILFIVVILGIVSSDGQTGLKNTSTEPAKEVFKTTAQQLFLDYERNEVAADEKMKGKIIEVTGIIQSIDKDFSDSIVVRLTTSNQFISASMYVDESQKQTALGLTKGASITLDCDQISRIMDSPSGSNCKFKRRDQVTSESYLPTLPDTIHTNITSQELAGCLSAAATTYQIPPAILIGIMQVEGGKVQGETKVEVDGTYAMGPMMVSSRLLPQLAKLWSVDIDTAHQWLRNDGCVNVNVAAWILHQKIIEAGNYYKGIAIYNSPTGKPDATYADRVVKAMREKGLVKEDKIIANNANSEFVVNPGQPICQSSLGVYKVVTSGMAHTSDDMSKNPEYTETCEDSPPHLCGVAYTPNYSHAKFANILEKYKCSLAGDEKLPFQILSHDYRVNAYYGIVSTPMGDVSGWVDMGSITHNPFSHNQQNRP